MATDMNDLESLLKSKQEAPQVNDSGDFNNFENLLKKKQEGFSPSSSPNSSPSPSSSFNLFSIDPTLDTSKDKVPKPDINPLTREDFWGDVNTGIVKTLLDAAQAPGKGVEALARKDLPGSPGQEFSPNILQPVSSTLYGIGKLAQKIENKFYPDLPADAPIYRQIAEGLGSTVGFALGGAAGTAAKLPALATTGLMGASVGATNQYDEATQMGATPDEAFAAYLGGAGVGSTEAIPGGYFLKKLDKITGGRVLQKVKDFGLTGEHGKLWNTLEGFLVEGGQEGLQQIGSNWVAKDLAGYDPNRELGENFWDNVLSGGAVGSMLGFGHAWVRDRQIQEATKSLDAQRDLRMNTNDPINKVAGAFTPVETYLGLKQLQQDIEDKLTQATEDSVKVDEKTGSVQVAADLLEPPVPGFINPLDQQASGLGQPYDITKVAVDPVADGPVETSVETGLPKMEDGSTMTVKKALETSPVVVAQEGTYGKMLQNYAKIIKSTQAEIAETTDPGDKFLLTKDLEVYKEKFVAVKEKQVIAKKTLGEVKNYVAQLRQYLAPDTHIILQNSPLTEKNKGANGSQLYTTDYKLENGQQIKLNNIFINLDKIVTEAYYNKQLGLPQQGPAFRRLFETITHEFGHVIATTNLRRVYDQARNGTPEEKFQAYKTIVWMNREYGNWLRNVSQGTQKDLFTTSFAAERANDFLTKQMKSGEEVGKVMDQKSAYEQMPVSVSKDYLYSFDEFFAEATARLATQGKLADPAITKFFSPAIEQYKKMFEAMPEFAKSDYQSNWNNFLQSKIISTKINEEKEMLTDAKGRDIFDALAGKIPGFDKKNFAGLQEYKDKFNAIIRTGFNVLQIAKENPHIPHWQKYIRSMMDWHSYKSNKEVEILDTLTKMKNLGKAGSSQVSNILYDENIQGARYDQKRLQTLLNTEELEAYNSVRSLLDGILEEMRQVSLQENSKNFLDNPEMLSAKDLEINTTFDKMKASGYFPLMRFGEFTVKAKANQDIDYNGTTFKKGQLITFPTFESMKERDQFYSRIKQELGNKATITASKLPEEGVVLQGMPSSLIRLLRLKLDGLETLTPEQQKAFDEALDSTAASGKFLKHFRKKKGIHGYSEDAMRSLAVYSRNAIGHLAKVKYADQIRDSIQGMKDDVSIISTVGGYAQTRQEMADWMQRHVQYVMNPTSELQALRSIGFFLQLGFNIKSAALNLTQIATTGLPYFSARYGYQNTLKELTRSSFVLQDWIRNKDKYIKADKNKDEKRIRLGQMFATGLHEGWLDQSLATELAIAASENNLDRGLHLPSGQRLWHNVSRYGAKPFHLVEKYNRYMTGVTAYNLEYEKTKDHAKAVQAAREANFSINFENARWNRPEFMRGKKSAALMFMSFTQNSLYFATHDKGALRWWLGMLMVAGVSGLPFAEDIEDLAEATGTLLNKWLGLKDPKVSLKTELRENLKELHLNPDLILHGLSQDSFGFGQVGELTGLPIPHFDLSGSIGMGNVLPLTSIPNSLINGDDADKVFRRAVVESAGAGGNLIDKFYSGITSKDPNTFKQAEKLMPIISLSNVMKASRLAMQGKEEMLDGTVVADFDMSDLRDQLTLVGQGLGFTPTKLTEGWEREIAIKDTVKYYKTQQAALQQQFNWALFNEDREALADVREKIREYNKDVPFAEMGITGKGLKQSASVYIKKRAIAEAGPVAERKYRRLQKMIEDTFENPAGGVSGPEPGP